MKIKASSRVEGIFAHAVAMDNRGLKNIIHCVGSNVFIVNFDHSMILRFSLRQSEVSFETPVSFNANEYDSPEFTFTTDEEGGKIVFHTASKEYTRKKICRTGMSGPDANDIRKVYRQLKREAEESEYLFYVSDDCIPLLEEGLSHTEISVENSALILRQRNVYTGTIVEIGSASSGFFTLDKLPKHLPPIALKTKDFMSLFTVRKSLAFIPTKDFVLVKDSKKDDFEGVLALCKYDMIIDLYQSEEGENNGREEQETGASEQAADRPHQVRRKRRK